ncbi:hypothetical protein CIB84_006567, partial [Bambusicola thoracicus]
VLAGLHFLHGRCRIIHADIKPENVLLYIHDKNLHRFLLDAAQCGQGTDLRLKAPDHVARIIELLGRIPPQIALSWNKSTKFFRRPGALLRISRLVPRSLHTILADRLKWRKHEVPPFTNFLLSALRYAPEKRATAAQCLQHAWLSAP